MRHEMGVICIKRKEYYYNPMKCMGAERDCCKINGKEVYECPMEYMGSERKQL
jgi:hypothetical protein